MGVSSQEQIARWQHDGFLSPFSLLNAAELKACREGLDRYNHFERVEPPRAELDAQRVATHERATTLYRNCYLEEEARHALLTT